MTAYKAYTKAAAKTKAKRMRKKGLNCSYTKLKNGYGVYTDQKGKR